MSKKKLFRVATTAASLNILLKGQLNYLNERFAVTAISSSGDEVAELQEREKIYVKNIEMKRGISPFSDLVSLIKLIIFFSREKPDIVHSITPKAGLLSMIAAKLTGVPVRIHTFTGLIFPYKKGILKYILILMDKILCFCATEIIPEGLGVKYDLVKHGITRKPLNVLANGNVNGIDYNHFSRSEVDNDNLIQLKQGLGLKDGDFVYLFLGRLVGDKGINELVSVFKESQKKLSNIKLLLVGDFEHKLDPLQKETIAEINNNEDILTTGFVKDVRPYFAMSDVLVFPSHREGFPNVVLQSLSMEVPAIVTDINGSNEIVDHNFNGVIIPPKSSADLYRSMLDVYHNSEFLAIVKSNARKSILHYEQDILWEAVSERYYTLLMNAKAKALREIFIPDFQFKNIFNLKKA